MIRQALPSLIYTVQRICRYFGDFMYLKRLRAAELGLLCLLHVLRLLCSLPAKQARLGLILAVERCTQRCQTVHAQVFIAEQGLQHLKLCGVVQRHAQLLQGLLRDLVLLHGLLHGHRVGQEGLLGCWRDTSWHALRLPWEDVRLGRRQCAEEPVQVLSCLQSLVSTCKVPQACELSSE